MDHYGVYKDLPVSSEESGKMYLFFNRQCRSRCLLVAPWARSKGQMGASLTTPGLYGLLIHSSKVVPRQASLAEEACGLSHAQKKGKVLVACWIALIRG